MLAKLDTQYTTTQDPMIIWRSALLRRTPRRSAASIMAMIREHEERRDKIKSSGTAYRDDTDGGAGETAE